MLTPAEWRVLDEVRAGRQNVEIAERLRVSHHTVKTQISSMLSKLELGDRHALAAWEGEPQEASRRVLGRGLLAPLGWLSSGSLTGGAKAAGAIAGAVLLVAAIVLVFSALDGGGDAARGGVTPAEGPGLVELLELLPDEPAVRALVSLGDIEWAREVSGVEAPFEAFSQESLADYWESLPMASQQRFDFLTGPGSTFRLPEAGALAAEHLGVSPFETDQWASASLGPGRDLSIVHGRLHAGAVAERLAACTECPPADETASGDWRIYAWGDEPGTAEQAVDDSRRFTPPFFDERGRAGRIAVADGTLMRAILMDDLQRMIDTERGEQSLADHAGFRAAAEGMEQLGAMTARLQDDFSELSPTWDEYAGDGRLLPYEVAAYGLGGDEAGTFIAITLIHDDGASTDENAARLVDRIEPAQEALAASLEESASGVRWNEQIGDLEVTVDGPVLLATMRVDETFLPSHGIEQYLWMLLAHE